MKPRKKKLVYHRKGYWYDPDNPSVHIEERGEPTLKDIYLAKLREAPIEDMCFRLVKDIVRYRESNPRPFVKYPVK